MNMDSMYRLTLGLVLLAAAWTQAALAGPRADDGPGANGVYHEGTIIDESSLAQMRGGFNIAGMEVYFGATLETVVDSARLTTVLNFTRSGAQLVSRTVTDAGVPVTRVGPNGVPLGKITPPNIKLSGFGQSSGIVINDAKGFTAALHNITDSAITSSVISDASGRNIRQKIDISVHIANMAELRAAELRSSILRQLPMLR